MANFDELVMLAAIEIVEEAEIDEMQPNRQFYPRVNAFNMSDQKFIRTFRLPKHLVQNLVDVLRDFIPAPTRASALDVETKVLIALRFFASGSYQLDAGSNLHTAVCQASVSRSIHEVVNALNQPAVFNTWVKFPNTIQGLQQKREQFYATFGFPGVVGCIDCTHVAIIAPKHVNGNNQEHLYVNRKNYHSINVQLICDSQMGILNINALYPGSTNDAFIWNQSNVKRVIERLHENGENSFYLLGDSGYPLRPWLLTPLEREPLPNTPEAVYNTTHKRTRCIIERCNGLLKMRFRCLLKHRVLHYAPEFASQIINACAVLHNICIENNVEEPEREEEDDAIDFGLFINVAAYGEADDVQARRVNPDLAEARRIQQRLIHNYFSNI